VDEPMSGGDGRVNRVAVRSNPGDGVGTGQAGRPRDRRRSRTGRRHPTADGRRDRRGTLLPSVREDLRLVVALLRNSAYTEDVGLRLYGVAAEFSRLAGWLACDSEQPALAQRYFAAGLRAAHMSGDRAIGANVLGFISMQAGRSDRPTDAIVLAESALQAERQLTPAVAASLHAWLARGAARSGDAA